mmetsp:Transcript_10581/g.21988  ORF Transcript_10581/g.21988 Transcript_10581/m.21988 type:complete len:200 (-) Transcript_10581:797-1396(-)
MISSARDFCARGFPVSEASSQNRHASSVSLSRIFDSMSLSISGRFPNGRKSSRTCLASSRRLPIAPSSQMLPILVKAKVLPFEALFRYKAFVDVSSVSLTLARALASTNCRTSFPSSRVVLEDDPWCSSESHGDTNSLAVSSESLSSSTSSNHTIRLVRSNPASTSTPCKMSHVCSTQSPVVNGKNRRRALWLDVSPVS